MLYHYSWLNDNGNKEEADIEATSLDAAIVLVENKGLKTVLEVKEKVDKENNILGAFKNSKMFKQKIVSKDVVLFSRQVSTLFEAGVSALKAFRLLAAENENPSLQEELIGVADDIEGGKIGRAHV